MKDYIQLAKPRIVLMVLVTAAFGYLLAGGREKTLLFWTLLGTALCATASGTLNQLWERDQDALMSRTKIRPLPQGRVSPRQALVFGLLCTLCGLGLLASQVNALAAGLAAFTIASYVLAYTPMKRLTPHSTWVGAMAGAMPPLIGWAAARGTLDSSSWALFAIQFLWQIPHFLAIFWLYREDYAAAGFRVLPVVDPGGGTTACSIALHSFALLLASLMPVFLGMAGLSYGVLALLLSGAFLGLGMRASWTMSVLDMRRLFLGSLVYLPLLFGMLVFAQAPAFALSTPDSPPPILGRVPDFDLREASGGRVRRSDLSGPWVAGFIFSRCAGQCPMITARLNALSRRLPGVGLISFSLDPDDTPAALSRYAKSHQASGLFLTGRKDEVRRLCREGFKLPVADGGSAEEPIIHSKKLVLVDGKGDIRGYFDADDEASVESLVRQARRL